jgi:pimeloyl-ACP methyl ester carboxylesterase
MPPVQLMRQIFVDTPIYIIQFQERGLAEWVFSWGRGADDFIDMIFGATAHNPDAFPDDVREVYKVAFRPAGALTPPIEYYRNMDRNWELTADVADRRIEQPALFLTGSRDPVRRWMPGTSMDGWVPGLREPIVVDGPGHWVQQEAPDAVNAALLEFLDEA